MTNSFEAVSYALPAYEIGGELGHGGCGVVLAGRHRQLQRQVAIKQLPGQFASDPLVRGRFTSEARLLASLDHPHVVPVYDFVEQDGLCLLVMEMLPGGTVWGRFTTDGFSAQAAVAVALASAAGLKAAHDRGILHRDVKPENLMFGASGALKVTDFGIAKMVGGGETLATRAGEVLGTPAYIAPEQARGAALSPATDVYALATMLYELLAGVLPFPDDGDAMALLFKHAFDQPIPLNQVAPNVSPAIAAVVMQGLATDPAQRYESAQAFGAALSAASRAQWGPDWLATQGVPVLGADTITAPTAPPPAPPTAASAAMYESTPAPPTWVPPPPPPPPPSWVPPPPPAPGQGPPPSASVVRPSITMHPAGAALVELSASDLVPVQRVVPPRATVPYLISAILALAAIAVAIVGIGTPPRGGSLHAVAIRVAGHTAISGARVPIDLTKPVPVAVAGGPVADTAQLSIQVLGFSVESHSAPLRAVGPLNSASLPAIGGQYVLAGHLTGKLTLLRQGQIVGTWSFPITTTQSALTTAVAGLTALIILFALAYLESFLRALRRSTRKVSGSIGVPAASAVLAIGVIGASWVLFGTEPTIATIAVCVALAILAGVAAAIGGLRSGRRRRLRRRPPAASPR